MSSDIAVLVYPQKFKKTWRAKSNFEWRGNIGILMLKDALERAGYSVGFCSPESAHKFKIVLASLISIWDYYNFIGAVARLGSWKNRDNTVLVGGWGLRNAAPLRHYADYAVFGRAENSILGIVQAVLTGKILDHPSVMRLKEFPHPVKFGQSETLYPFELDTKPIKYKEFSIGCSYRCYFCIYTFARKRLKEGDDPYYETSTKFHMSKELVLNEVKLKWDGQSVNVRTSIDGWSERLRFAFNKKIKDEDVISMLEFVSDKATSDPTHINTYMIAGYPTETGIERERFLSMLERANPKGKKIVLKLIVVPFRPAPLTPSAWCASRLDINWKSVTRGIEIIRRPKYDVSYENKSVESPWSLLQSLIIERASSESDELIKTICFSKQLNTLCVKGKVDAIGSKFDLGQYTKEYDIDGDTLPTWYLESYTPNEAIENMARKLKENLKGGCLA